MGMRSRSPVQPWEENRALPYLKKSKKFPSLCASEPLDPTAAPLWGAKTGVFNARAAFSRETCLAHLNAT